MSSIKRNLVYNFILSVSQVFLPLLSIPYISRVLTPAGIGEVSFIDSFTFYFISIAEFGIVVYGMREVARLRNEPEKKEKLVSELLLLHIISSSFTLVLYGVAVYFIWSKIHDIRILYFSLSFLIVNFFACEWYFLGMEKFRYITFRSVLCRVLGLVSIYILIKQPSDYFIYYAIIASSAMLNSLWNNYLLFKEVSVSFKNTNWKRHIPKLRITYFISLVYGITLILDNVLLRIVSTASAVGYYAFSVKIVRISTTLLSDSLQVFFPRIVYFIRQNNRKKVQLMITLNLQLLILFSVPICAGVFLLAEPLVIIFLGEQFIPATGNLRILAAFPLLKSYNHFLSKQVLISHNRERLYLNGLVVTSVVFVFLMLFLSYKYADSGASYAIMLAEILLLLINYYYVRKTSTDLQVFDLRTFIHALVGASLFIPVVYLIRKLIPSPLPVLIISMGSCFFVYVIIQAFVIRNNFMLILKDVFIRRCKKLWSFFFN
ncbi:MAG: oligosaccharide flippase family protein [Chitinophagaceae bacterium]|nr:oligosaccharide flippase family protein [Chitinophagaceae bacterium]